MVGGLLETSIIGKVRQCPQIAGHFDGEGLNGWTPSTPSTVRRMVKSAALVYA